MRSFARRALRNTRETMQSIIATLEQDGSHQTNGPPGTWSGCLRPNLRPDGRSALRAAHEIVANAESLVRSAVAPDDPEIIYSALLRIAEAMR